MEETEDWTNNGSEDQGDDVVGFPEHIKTATRTGTAKAKPLAEDRQASTNTFQELSVLSEAFDLLTASPQGPVVYTSIKIGSSKSLSDICNTLDINFERKHLKTVDRHRQE
ncbi:hypothetical protein N7488_006461 [Penicillium malachiteum]|nr:hypothetical protein N7488_006461 [Penicillium malachiteum]